MHLVNVWAAEQRLVLGQLAVDQKSNEIKAVPELLELLSLYDVTITADAMHCQRDLSEQITQGNGQYVLAVKGNQKTLYDDIHFMMENEIDTVAVTESGHGRIETRSATVITDLDWLQQSHQWPGLGAVGRITRRRELADKITEETAYYLLSEALSPERMIDVTRQHWDIENSLHWVLDVTFKEDDSRTRCGHGAENLSLVRKLALNLIEKAPTKGSKKGKRKQAGWNDDHLLAIIQQVVQLR
ncbi:ISAs1 family transposase [Halomonas llamarensis]|uniref:ISAs1 family transposase n=1 Tax=Halomonas llamarensis TaxID=2945104 RepID=UPI0024C37705|nr:ISAs1 family transposase [Halomonas llamarensis]